MKKAPRLPKATRRRDPPLAVVANESASAGAEASPLSATKTSLNWIRYLRKQPISLPVPPR
jgi:hypothetical protein